MKIAICVLFYAFLNVVDGRASNLSLLNGKMSNGHIVRTELPTTIASFRKEGHHFCTGFFVSVNVLLSTHICALHMFIPGTEEINFKINAHFEGISCNITSIRLLPRGITPVLDIAFIAIEIQKEYEKNVRFTNLSNQVLKLEEEYDLFGWGNTREAKASSKFILQWATFVIKDHSVCQPQFCDKAIDVSYSTCAMTKELFQSIETKDAGSPLIKGKEVIGVVSWVQEYSGNYIIFTSAAAINQFYKDHDIEF